MRKRELLYLHWKCLSTGPKTILCNTDNSEANIWSTQRAITSEWFLYTHKVKSVLFSVPLKANVRDFIFDCSSVIEVLCQISDKLVLVSFLDYTLWFGMSIFAEFQSH